MFFSSLNLPSSISKTAEYTFLSVLLRIARVKLMAEKFVATSIRLMRNQQAIFANMQRFAGVKNPLLLLMPRRTSMLPGRHLASTRTRPSPQHFNELQKVKSLTVIASTLQLKLGILLCFVLNWSIAEAFNRAEIVRWVAESKRPFQIVNDRAFQSLMKTGRPGYRIPSAETVSRDVKQVFIRVRARIAKMLQVFI